MTGLDPMVLPEDIRLVPVGELPPETRAKLDCEDGDFALTRPLARTPTKIVDARAAALLEQFRKPATLVQGIVSHSREHGLDPERTLEEAYPLLANLVRSGILVPADSDRAHAITPSSESGELPGGVEPVACIQVLEDTEVHQVRLTDGRIAALKLARPGIGPLVRQAFERETALLKLMGGEVVPALYASGEEDERPYLILDWFGGVDVLSAAHELRSGDRPQTRELATLAGAVVDAYARLHDRGVVHSDVHPHNTLVDADGGVLLLDLGFARIDHDGHPLASAPRAGVPFYFEPEYARAILADEAPPASSRLGEQYAVAALLYQLFTGELYLEFSLESDELLRQVAEEPPLRFAARRAPAWPSVEAVLRRALAKTPGDRYASMREFGAALAEAAEAAVLPAARGSAAVDAGERLVGERLVGDVLRRLDPDGVLFTEGIPAAPTCSVNFGAAGIAYALHRLAATRGSAELLSWADLWCTRALRDAESDEAFYNPDLDLPESLIGRVSPYHTRAGVHAVEALIARARDDTPSLAAAVAGFVASSQPACDTLDLTLGRSGTLLAAAVLAEALGGGAERVGTPLLDVGRARLGDVWAEAAVLPPVTDCPALPNLGIAHGWAGLAFAALRWCEVTGDPLPDGLGARLDQLAECAEPWGRGLRWPWLSGAGPDRTFGYMSGWCNGSAGFVHLWTLAHRTLGGGRWLRLAEGAAWHAWEHASPTGNLCCGLAGRAYGLLDLHRLTGEDAWLLRARDLADRAARADPDPELPWYSLYKGELGVAVLASDLAVRPPEAVMPFFGSEGWPGAG